MGFERVFIIGFGQMGKSIANTLRTNDFQGKILVSSGHKIDNCEYIDGNFNIENYNNDYENSIIFICVPPDFTNKVIEKMMEKIKNTNCIISDICSVKNNIFSNNKIIKNSNFISIHPMDGGNSDTVRANFFKRQILNYIITDNFAKIDINVLARYNNFLHDFLNYKNYKITSKKHDKIVAFTSHLSNLILASYYNDFSKIDNKMLREIFIQNQENIKHFLNIFLEKIKQKIGNNLLVDVIILTIKDIMQTEKIKIKQELFNPSLRAIFELKNNNLNAIKTMIDYSKFVENMENFFENLVCKM